MMFDFAGVSSPHAIASLFAALQQRSLMKSLHTECGHIANLSVMHCLHVTFVAQLHYGHKYLIEVSHTGVSHTGVSHIGARWPCSND